MASNKQEAKDFIENKIANLFGSDYIDSIDNKIYVWGHSKDGEKIQVALSLTCPASPIDVPKQDIDLGFDWSKPPSPPKEEKKEIVDEVKNLEILFKSLGL